MFACGAKTGSEQKIKFFVKLLYKKLAVSKGRAFGRLPLFIVQALIGRARELFAREKVLENRLRVECNLKNYPVDDFDSTSLNLVLADLALC